MHTFINLNKDFQEKLSFDKPGLYVVYFHNLSGNFTFELNVPDVQLYIYGLFTGKKEDKYSIGTTQHHRAPSATSDLFIKGVFDDESKFDYEGLIRIEKEAQGSHAYQKNQNLILSPRTYVESKPFLEILANDVFCTHGSTTGKLNQEQLFYTQSRGLSPDASKKLLVDGFTDEIFERIKQKIPEVSFN